MASSPDSRSVFLNMAGSKKWSVKKKLAGIRGVSTTPTGYLRITKVEMYSPAYQSGLRSGDLIVSIENGRIPVANFTQLQKDCAESGTGITLQISSPQTEYGRPKTPAERKEQHRLHMEEALSRESLMHRESRLQYMRDYQSQCLATETPKTGRASRLKRLSQNQHRWLTQLASPRKQERKERLKHNQSEYWGQLSPNSAEKKLQNLRVGSATWFQSLSADAKSERVSRELERRDCSQEFHKTGWGNVSDGELMALLDETEQSVQGQTVDDLRAHQDKVDQYTEYFDSKYRCEKGTEPADKALSSMTAYWEQFWQKQRCDVLRIKARVDGEEKSLKRRGVPDAQREIYKWKKTVKLVRQEKLESPAEKELREEEEDLRGIHKRVLAGLNLADPKGLADHIKAKRQERLEQRGLEALHEELTGDGWDPMKFVGDKAAQEGLRDYFQGLIADFPNRACISCRRYFYRYQITNFTPKALEKMETKLVEVEERLASADSVANEELKEWIRTRASHYRLAVKNVKKDYEEAQALAAVEPRLYGDPEKPSLVVCNSCWKQLRGVLEDGYGPQHGTWNIAPPEPVPENLGKLNDLGLQLLSLVIPFQKIVALPRGSQRGVQGGVISIPANIDHSMSRILPHDLNSGCLVSVELKKKLVYKSSDRSQLINPEHLFNALRELAAGNPLYKGIDMKHPKLWMEEIEHQEKNSPVSILQLQEQPEDEEDGEEESEDDEEDGEQLVEAWKNPIPATCMFPVNGPAVGDVNRLAHTLEDEGRRRGAPQAPVPQSLPTKSASQPTPVVGAVTVEENGREPLGPSAKVPSRRGGFQRSRRLSESAKTHLLCRIGDTFKRKVAVEVGGASARVGEERARHRSDPAGGNRIARRKIAVAPGQDQKPLPIWRVPNIEEQAFPGLHPTGTNGPKVERKKNLTLGDYIKNRLSNVDRRFAKSAPWIFFNLFRVQYERLLKSINVTLNKASVENEYNEKINDKDWDVGSELFADAFVKKDAGYRFMNSLKGTPAYWKRTLNDLLAMVRQLGPPTIFLTLSADDLHWPDVLRPIMEIKYKRTVEDHELAALTGRQRNALIREYPDLAARQFHKRVRLFFEKLIQDPATNPFGRKVKDFFYRFEWQGRGSPHVHSLIWFEDAPVLGVDPQEEFVEWADQLVHTKLPDPKTDPELYELVDQLQTHRHRPTCQTLEPKTTLSDKDKEKMSDEEIREFGQDARCRFKFPREVSKQTYLTHDLEPILRPSNGEESHSQPITSESAPTAEDLPPSAQSQPLPNREQSPTPPRQFDPDLFSEYQSGRVELTMRRDENAIRINNYHPGVLRIWRANMDIQMVTNSFAAIQYIAAYISKVEKALGDAMKEVMQSLSENTDFKLRLRRWANAYANSRQMSVQEAIHHLLGLPLQKKTRQVVFLSTGWRNKRHRMLKPKAKLRELPKDAKPDDYFLDGLLQQYEKRVVPENSPHAASIAEMCLATFAAWYKKKSGAKPGAEDENGEGGGDEEADILGEDEGSNELPPTVDLDGGGYMVRRRRKAVVRYHRFDPQKDGGEEFHYSVLVLFHPFQAEAELELSKAGYDKYKSFFEAKKDEIQPLLTEFESYSGPIAQAFDEMEKARQEALADRLGANEEGGNAADDAPPDQGQQAGDFDFLDPEDLVMDVLDGVGGVGEDGGPDGDPPSADAEGFKVQAALGLSKTEILAELSSIEAKLNTDQKTAYEAGIGRIQAYKEARRLGKTYGESPLFISGPGGTGKSFLLRAIKLRIHLELHEDLEDLTSVTMAPTGTSALNVSGDTVHHALCLPIQQNRAFVQSFLSDKKLQELKNKYATTHAWLIDEVSMISSNSLYHINNRLNAIAGVTDPSVFFGGMIVIFFGDLAQLQPVCAPRPYANPSANIVGAGGVAVHLWRDLVEMVELTIVERQKGDQDWAELLTRIRGNEHTKEDEATLKTRLLSELNLDPTSPTIRDLPHLFHTNAEVDSFNAAKLTALVKEKESQLTREGLDPSSSSLHLLAHDDFDGQTCVKKNKYKGDFSKLIPKSRNETGGLHSELRLCLGARVVLKRNIDVEDGLVNGSMGKVVGWHRNKRDGLPLCIYVQFDKVNGKLVGRKARKELNKYLMGDMPSSYVPLLPSKVTFKGANRSRFTISREMFALCLAWALTVHSCQGMTLERAVLDLGSSCIPCAVAYVGLSRVVSMEGLFLLRFHPNAIRCDARALREMERLRAFSNKDAATGNAVSTTTEDTEQSTERVDSGEKPRSSTTKQYSCGKKKAIATLEKLSAAVKDAGKSLGRSMCVLPSLANSGFESLGPEMTEAGRWVIATFVGSTPCSLEHFLEYRLPAMRAAIGPNSDVLHFILTNLRRLAVLRLDQLPRGVKRDRGLGDVLYQCLANTVCPIQTIGDGNCLYHAVAISLFGKSERRVGGHTVIRGLCLVMALLFRDHLQFLMEVEARGGAAEDHRAPDITAQYHALLFDLHSPSRYGDRFANYLVSLALHRPVAVMMECFERGPRGALDTTKPRGGVEVSRSLPALVAAFAAGPTNLPDFHVFRALPDRLHVRPIFMLLHGEHFSACLTPKTFSISKLPTFPVAWDNYLPIIRQRFPLPISDAQLYTVMSSFT